MRSIIIIAMAALLAPGAAQAYSYLGAVCEGSEIHVSLHLFNDVGEDAAGLPVVVEMSPVGTCGPVVAVATDPIAMPAFLTESTVDFTAPATEPDVYYRFDAYLVRPDDSRDYLLWATGAAGCGEAVAGRGYLTTQTNGSPWLRFTPCTANGCWDAVLGDGAEIDATGIVPADLAWAVDTGVAVELLGTAVGPGGFPDAPEFILGAVRPLTGDCDIVAEEATSWGSLKAQYR